MTSGLLRGVFSGAAGTTALNAVTYLDMAVRGRSTSSAPQDLIEKSAQKAGIEIPGDNDTKDNRVQGLGPLAGIATGVVVGAVFGGIDKLLARRGWSIPAPVQIVAIGAAAMALSDVPLKLLGISDPADWAASDWVSDAIPHLVFGAVTYAGLQAQQ